MENTNQINRTLDLLNETGLAWEVKKKPLFALNEAGINVPTKAYGIFKGDKHLGTTGERYEPFQNYQLAETIINATERLNLPKLRGGSLCDDTKIYLQAELQSDTIGKSEIKRYITALNSHNGTSAIGFGSSNTVVVCQNTFYMAYKELTKFKHTINAESRVKDAVELLKLTLINDEMLMEDFKVMANKPLNDEIVERVIRNLFKVEKNMKQDDVSTRKVNQLSEFGTAIHTSIEEQGSTIWALFNGVTRYTNHITAPTDANDKLSYLMDGSGYQKNLIGFNTIMDWIKQNSIEYATI
jgi:hypothetical protein